MWGWKIFPLRFHNRLTNRKLLGLQKKKGYLLAELNKLNWINQVQQRVENNKDES